MVNIMQLWEVILLVVSFAFVAVCVYLILTLKTLTNTVKNLDVLIQSNTQKINSIITNVDIISSDAQNMVGTANKAVVKVDSIATNIKKKSKNSKSKEGLFDVKTLISLCGFLSATIQMMKNNKLKKNNNNSKNKCT